MGQLITKTDFVFIPITSFVYQAYFSDPDGNALIPHHRYAPPGVKPPTARSASSPP